VIKAWRREFGCERLRRKLRQAREVTARPQQLVAIESRHDRPHCIQTGAGDWQRGIAIDDFRYGGQLYAPGSRERKQ
jgi:hypothetical protein